MSNGYLDSLNRFSERNQLATKAVALVNDLWVHRSVEVLLFRRSLINENPLAILKHHSYGRQIAKTELTVLDSFPILQYMAGMSLCPSRIDLGTLTLNWVQSGRPKEELGAFVEEELKDHFSGACVIESRDVVLYGFGRIGRLLARILIEKAGGGDSLQLKAVVCRGRMDLKKRANLLRRDSVHGSFRGIMEVDEANNRIIANGVVVQFISADSPEQVDYEQYGIHNALVIDNTGVWRDREGLSLHLKAKGVDKVLLTAPGKGDIPNIVYGVNTRSWEPDENIFSAASCTTNAIVPPMKVLNDAFGIKYGHIETVHSYTNDQNLLDNYHKKSRRGRSAALNMVLTETGAASAVAKALPELAGRITGNAVRVPTPNISLAILNLDLAREATREEVNETLRQASLKGPLVAQIDYTRDEDVVSSDMIGNRHAAIVDSLATIVQGNRAIVYVWYDNEFGYSLQVDRLARIISGVEKLRYY